MASRVGGGYGLGHEEGGVDREQAEAGRQDDAGEAHAADGGAEQLGVVGAAAAAWHPVRGRQGERLEVGAEGTVALVILAVHVGGDHAADGDEPGAGHDRGEPATGSEHLEDVGEQDAGLAGEQPGIGVEREHPVEGQQRQGEVRVEGGVAVGAGPLPRAMSVSQRSSSGGRSAARRRCWSRQSRSGWRPQPDSVTRAPPAGRELPGSVAREVIHKAAAKAAAKPAAVSQVTRSRSANSTGSGVHQATIGEQHHPPQPAYEKRTGRPQEFRALVAGAGLGTLQVERQHHRRRQGAGRGQGGQHHGVLGQVTASARRGAPGHPPRPGARAARAALPGA